MGSRRVGRIVLVAALAAAVASCGDDDSPSNGTDPVSTDSVGLANPAAVFCEEQGGTTYGPEPMCELPDGTVVDAWEYFRAETGEGG